MKVTKEQAEKNREALLAAAGRLFRERGIDGVGVAEICREAGLTHGALYAQFPSKEALAAEALDHALASGYDKLVRKGAAAPIALTGFLNFYLSPRMRDDRANSCALIAAAGEAARHDDAVAERLTEGYERLVRAFESELADSAVSASRRKRALTAVAAIVGGVAIARGAAHVDRALSDELLAALRDVVGELGGEPRAARRKRPRETGAP